MPNLMINGNNNIQTGRDINIDKANVLFIKGKKK